MYIPGIAKNLKYFRKLAGLTQEETAEKSGLSYSHYVKLENSNNAPSLESLINICTTLNAPLDCMVKDGGWKTFAMYSNIKLYQDMSAMSEQEFAMVTSVINALHEQVNADKTNK